MNSARLAMAAIGGGVDDGGEGSMSLRIGPGLVHPGVVVAGPAQAGLAFFVANVDPAILHAQDHACGDPADRFRFTMGRPNLSAAATAKGFKSEAMLPLSDSSPVSRP